MAFLLINLELLPTDCWYKILVSASTKLANFLQNLQNLISSSLENMSVNFKDFTPSKMSQLISLLENSWPVFSYRENFSKLQGLSRNLLMYTKELTQSCSQTAINVSNWQYCCYNWIWITIRMLQRCKEQQKNDFWVIWSIFQNMAPKILNKYMTGLMKKSLGQTFKMSSLFCRILLPFTRVLPPKKTILKQSHKRKTKITKNSSLSWKVKHF